MKHRILIEVPLSGINDQGEIQADTFTIPPPCFYCGKPIATTDGGYFNLKGDYQIKFWGFVQDTHQPRLGNVIDPHGNLVKGYYTIKVPYCAEHIEPVKAFTVIDILTVLCGILLGVGWTAIFGRELLSGTPLILAFIFLPVLLAALFYAAGLGIKALLPKLVTKLKDHAVFKGHYGICSHGVRVDGGEEMEGPITYWLKLTFCQPEGAKRFLAEVPEAKVLRGKRFL